MSSILLLFSGGEEEPSDTGRATMSGFAQVAFVSAVAAASVFSAVGAGAASFAAPTQAAFTMAGTSSSSIVGSSSGGSLVDYDLTTGTIPAGTTFTRSATDNTASLYDSAGTMQFVGADVPRFDYDPVTLAIRGLLIEPQRQNILPISTPNSSWIGQGFPHGQYFTISTNSTTSPTGATTANTLLDTALSGGHQCSSGTGTSTTSGQYYELSVFAKQKEQYALAVRGAYGPTFPNGYATFDLRDGSIPIVGSGVTAFTENCGNGWYRCVIIKQAANSNDGPKTAIGLSNNDLTNPALPAYAGTGTGIYVFGGSAVLSQTKTSYIPTAGLTVTRFADVFSFTIPSGVTTLRYTFDDNSTQDVSVSAGAYTVPTDLNRAHLKRIHNV